MSIRKKSNDTNRNYPVLGFRITKAERDDFLGEFEASLELLQRQPEYRWINLKKNAVFLRALEIGIDQIKKRKSLA